MIFAHLLTFLISIVLLDHHATAHNEASVTRTVVLKPEATDVAYTSNQVEGAGQGNVSSLAQEVLDSHAKIVKSASVVSSKDTSVLPTATPAPAVTEKHNAAESENKDEALITHSASEVQKEKPKEKSPAGGVDLSSMSDEEL